LLAYLLLHREASVSRRKLAFLFWPDSSEGQARTNLRHLIHELRCALPQSEQFLVGDQDTVGWNLTAPYSLDVADFDRLAAQKGSPEALRQAVNLYRDELLPGVYPDWILAERARLEQQYKDALIELSAHYEEQGNYLESIQVTRQLLLKDPLSEPVYCSLMRLHAWQGDRAGVMRFYETCADTLERELGVFPSAGTQVTYLYCLQKGGSAQKKSLVYPISSTGGRRGNLPAQLSSLIGWKLERQQVSEAVGRKADAVFD
jgi:DNA-binding SARP family transcriptional activator